MNRIIVFANDSTIEKEQGLRAEPTARKPINRQKLAKLLKNGRRCSADSGHEIDNSVIAPISAQRKKPIPKLDCSMTMDHSVSVFCVSDTTIDEDNSAAFLRAIPVSS